MSTIEYTSVARPATQLEVAMRHRTFGPGMSIAFTNGPIQGTSAPALVQTSVKASPAAIAKDGDASGLRRWSHPV
ncbi:MAG: hypothetical protein J2P24_03125 [Streptosporangiales bacterium]|nr:hypothetical protein [Streptosporangiales bacterium]MBO0889660.1 hypothetical protein [Acidothermales bacterium]